MYCINIAQSFINLIRRGMHWHASCWLADSSIYIGSSCNGADCCYLEANSSKYHLLSYYISSSLRRQSSEMIRSSIINKENQHLFIINRYTTMGLLTYVGVTILGIIGFAITGPVAGSLAAVIQSTFYGGAVTAGSWFAVAQSVAMAAPTPWLFIGFV